MCDRFSYSHLSTCDQCRAYCHGVKRNLRIVAVIVTGVLGLTAAACTGHNTSSVVAPKLGVVTGSATPCVGAASSYAYRRIPVRITLTKGSQIVAHQSGHGTVTYRFSVAPGKFQVSSDQSGTSPVTVTIRSGATIRVDLVSHCL